MTRQNRHDNLVYSLERYILSTMDVDRVFKFWEYSRNGQVGEVDLLVMADGIYDFYEVKSSRTDHSIKKAQSQYDRFKLAFPKWDTNGFFYSGQNIVRLFDGH